MKNTLILIILLISTNLYSQKDELREVALSPNENLIAFTYYADKVLDIFIYDLVRDSITRVTNSSELNFDQQYKTFLNWIDNEHLIFISKHNGLAQQYILNIKENTFILESSSTDHEYNLIYSRANSKTYYTSSRKGKEPAVFIKTLGKKDEEKVSIGNVNCILTSISPDGKYLSYKEMPIGRPRLISLENNKEIKLKLPQKNTTITQWDPSSKKFIYSHSYFIGDKKIPVTDLNLYDLETHKSMKILEEANYISGSLWAPCDMYFYSSLDKSYLLDTATNTKEEYNVIGTPISFMNKCKAILFMGLEKKKIFILNLSNGSIKGIIN